MPNKDADRSEPTWLGLEKTVTLCCVLSDYTVNPSLQPFNNPLSKYCLNRA